MAEGYTEVPVIIAAGWSKRQCRIYALADNKLGLDSEWDKELLRSELLELQDEEFDLSLTGFSGADLDDALTIDPPAAAEKEPSADRPMKTVIQFNIVFDNELQQSVWFDFVRRLKADYPKDETLGARLAHFLNEAEAPADGAV